MIKIPNIQLLKTLVWVMLTANIIFLDWIVLGKPGEITTVILPDPKNVDNQITQTVVLISPTIVSIPSSIPSPVVSPSVALTKKYVSKQYRELYITIGSGSSKSSKWDAIEGVEVNIDTNKYPKILESYFQASLRIPTANGEVSSKLYNETEKHDVWFSEITSQGSEAKLKEAKINLSPGPNSYRVYLKSSLEADALLDLARIKLIIEE